MDKYAAIARLAVRWPSAAALRKEYPELSHLLEGEFVSEKFNAYEFDDEQNKGIVVSRPIEQGLEVNPTLGLILPGKYKFNTDGNTETMIVLEGRLKASLKYAETTFSELGRFGSIIAPAGWDLHLATEKEVFYLCQYRPEKR